MSVKYSGNKDDTFLIPEFKMDGKTPSVRVDPSRCLYKIFSAFIQDVSFSLFSIFVTDTSRTRNESSW